MRSDKTRETLVAESPAGPNTPAQAHDLVAAFGTEVGTIIGEERQACEAFLNDAGIIGDFVLVARVQP